MQHSPDRSCRLAAPAAMRIRPYIHGPAPEAGRSSGRVAWNPRPWHGHGMQSATQSVHTRCWPQVRLGDRRGAQERVSLESVSSQRYGSATVCPYSSSFTLSFRHAAGYWLGDKVSPPCTAPAKHAAHRFGVRGHMEDTSVHVLSLLQGLLSPLRGHCACRLRGAQSMRFHCTCTSAHTALPQQTQQLGSLRALYY